MRKKRIFAIVASCLLLMSVFMSIPISVSAGATGVPGDPIVKMLDTNGTITCRVVLLSGNNNATQWRLYENGKIIQCGAAEDNTPNGQVITPEPFTRPAGQYTYICELINKYGSTFSSETTLSVNHGFIDEVPQAIFTEKFENGANGWTVVSSGSGSTVQIEDGTGVYGSKCVKISSPTVATDTAYTKTISGLTVGEKYRLTAYVKYQNVVRDPNSNYWPVIGPNVCIYPTWNYSSEWENLGTFYPGWKKIYAEFTASTTSVDIAVRLGYTGSKVTGTAWFDNVTLEHLPKYTFMETFENGLSSDWVKRSSKQNNSSATGTIEIGTGLNNSKCLKISSLAQDEDVGYARTLQLAPNSYYKLSAYMKYENVTEEYTVYNGTKQETHYKSDGANICLYNNQGEDAIWNRTVTATGTNTSWKEVSLLFKTPESGRVNIGLRLGFLHCETKGTVWFDNVKVEPVPSDYIYESEHFDACFDTSDTQYTTREGIINWLSDLDKVYVLMKEFSGNRIPFNGNKIGILASDGHPSGSAAYAGNPIMWFKSSDNNPIANQLKRSYENGDLSFGILHEIGHNFNLGNTSWNWNDEMFANFRAYYAVDQLEKIHLNNMGPMPVVYNDPNIRREGTQLKYYYLIRYLQTMGQGEFHHDGLMYRLIEVQEEIGWEPFLKTIQYLSDNDYSDKNDLEKFKLFYSKLSEYSQRPESELISNKDLSLVESFWEDHGTLFTR
ncbi:carbohydrate-binding protein CenC [Acetivibrio mesophilus]|uniref:Carbohydrate-binding protein CenC n=1 Tax=Acetivibrio mesophilus TaxID=2487273 RepID=A0A4Q0I327_9FIRM|nr:carbohydrate-binding protein CenC [Acetivibrio mesophilus]ODM27713.1 carbohydrate-binding protein CenC [Clostridium sp. Bc-iso-3]RXE58654.1 carbohydrate-binding protein CenC [Acetivibrio mesophilus]HHV30130.1 carbohydrate-binding protein CenC [Clostridium sp.]